MRIFSCNICNKILKNAKSLSNHVRYGCPSTRIEEIKKRRKIECRKGMLKYLKNHRKEFRKHTKKYAKSEKGRIVKRKSRIKNYKLNPETNKAISKLNYYVKIGKIKKNSCEVCKVKKVEGHHYKGYEYPLVVKWLCHKHHLMEHNRYYL